MGTAKNWRFLDFKLRFLDDTTRMKLYVIDKTSNEKVYLNTTSPSRLHLAETIGNQWFELQGQIYHVHEVIAEKESNETTAGAIIGGLIGLLGGPYGAVIGGLVGGAIGNENDKPEKKFVEFFNESHV
jgi:hypothetical protein